MTTAERVRKQFQQISRNTPKECPEDDNRQSALRSAAVSLDALQAAMRTEKLSQDDLSAWLVLGEVNPAATDIGLFQTISLVIGGQSMLSDAALKVLDNSRCVAVGTVFQITDRETPERVFRQWATTLLGDAASVQVMQEVLARMKSGKGTDA